MTLYTFIYIIHSDTKKIYYIDIATKVTYKKKDGTIALPYERSELQS